jgi:predicted nuclease of predicted toxin-antitoxin system
MKFLADECLREEIVAALRAAGYEVATVASSAPGAPDQWVLGHAARSRAILLTADKDVGEIAIGRGMPPPGIVLFRRPAAFPLRAAARLLRLIEEHGDELYQCYAVITPFRTRLRRLRPSGGGRR